MSRSWARNDFPAGNKIDSDAVALRRWTFRRKARSLAQRVFTATFSGAIVSSTSPAGQGSNIDIKAYKDCIDWGIISSQLHIRAIIHILLESPTMRDLPSPWPRDPSASVLRVVVA
jgi:hypothetical protein